MTVQHIQTSTVHAEHFQPKYQCSVTADPRRNRKGPSLLRLQSTNLCNTQPAWWAMRFPWVHLCKVRNSYRLFVHCSLPSLWDHRVSLQSCASWMPADHKTPFPSYSCLPSTAAAIYPRLRLLSPPFFPDFILSFPGLSRKTLCST